MQDRNFDPTKAIGADVSSTLLALSSAEPTKPIISIPNTPAAITRWLKLLPQRCHIGMEATGSYHRCLADLAVAAGHTVWVFNPTRIAHYLRSQNVRGKTDPQDARGIARYVLNEAHRFHPYTTPTALHDRLHQLIQRRHQITKQRASLRMSLADLHDDCQTQLEQLLAGFDSMLTRIDELIDLSFADEPQLRARRTLLCSINGFGPLVSAAVAARLNRVPYENSDAVVAAFGLDPRPRDSGNYKGLRKLSKMGNPEERRLLYCAAMAACRATLFKQLRDKLLARGFSKIQAYCVISRKLLRIAFSVWRSNKPFNPQLVGAA
jgi:transposase